ncbi:MAG TPA: Rrf2 family transcriptional regulator [Longimicrobium sp.]|jgi:Rrf2 family protein|uniref:RrF2 family transcriptional regulator n=1 Tax=Longimicrobium sp. TaxID=2029185 RepID=UPI002EDAFEA3
MLSQTSEHAIRAMLYLARQAPGEAVPADRIARALGAPGNYLGKTLQLLARRGLLASTRGPAGGFRLLEAPDRIALADVVAAVDDAPRPSAVCLLGNRPCRAASPCAAHARWSTVQHDLWAPLHRTTIAGLLEPASTKFDGEPVSAVNHQTAAAA